MRIVRNVLIGLVGLILIAVVGAFFLPRHVIIERSTVLDAPPEAVFQHVNSLQAFSAWSPWNDYDPDMQVTFSGPEAGVGNVMEWTSEHPQVGQGRQEIVASVENESVRTSLDFGDMGTAEAWWTLAAEGDGTRLVWGLDADMGNNPIGRWMGLMMDDWVGADYENGFERLHSVIEG